MYKQLDMKLFCKVINQSLQKDTQQFNTLDSGSAAGLKCLHITSLILSWEEWN